MGYKASFHASFSELYNISGKAKYRNRVLDSNSHKLCANAKRIVVTQIGTLATPDPCKTILGRFMNRFFSLPNEEVGKA